MINQSSNVDDVTAGDPKVPSLWGAVTETVATPVEEPTQESESKTTIGRFT